MLPLVVPQLAQLPVLQEPTLQLVPPLALAALVILSPSVLVLVLALLVLPTQQPTVLRLSVSVRQATTTQTQSSHLLPRYPPARPDIVALETV